MSFFKLEVHSSKSWDSRTMPCMHNGREEEMEEEKEGKEEEEKKNENDKELVKDERKQ